MNSVQFEKYQMFLNNQSVAQELGSKFGNLTVGEKAKKSRKKEKRTTKAKCHKTTKYEKENYCCQAWIGKGRTCRSTVQYKIRNDLYCTKHYHGYKDYTSSELKTV